MSPASDQLSYFDTEPYMQYMYNTPSNCQSPYLPQLSAGLGSRLDDYLKQELATSSGPSSSPSEDIWDDYIAWDSPRSPMAPQPSWSLQTSEGASSAPLFSEFSD